MPTAHDLQRASEAVSEHLPPTPLLPLEVAGEQALLKLETFQPTGSFKVRGAVAALSTHAASGLPVVTASAGNHGLGVAYAAARLGVEATVVVSRNASSAKVDALKLLGVHLVQHGEDYDAAEAHALSLADQGAVYVSPYNDPDVIAGQATVAAEVAAATDEPLTLVVPVGGGGLLAGTVLWAGSALSAGRANAREIRIVGVEAAASRAVSASIAAGHVVGVTVSETLADGLAGNLEPGAITPELVRGTGIVAVTEHEIEDAIRYLASTAGIVAEGSGAVGVAALLAGMVERRGRTVVIITGRNIAQPLLARVLGDVRFAGLNRP